MSRARQSIYDHPLYYDILFGWNRDAEAAFYAAALCRYGAPPPGPVLEVGVGTGQVALRLRRLGFAVLGLDRSLPMLAFCEARAREQGLALATLCADMCGFELSPPHPGALCALGTLGGESGIEVTDHDETRELDWGPTLRHPDPEEIAALLRERTHFRLEAIHPESGRDVEGVSLFSLEHTSGGLAPGRAMLVLRRS